MPSCGMVNVWARVLAGTDVTFCPQLIAVIVMLELLATVPLIR